MYFKKFPVIYYPVTIGGVSQYTAIKDVTINVRFIKEVLSNITLYDYYDIVDGETPEIISEKFYGTPFYHWIIMIANERYDYIDDFPLTYNLLHKYVQDKYGVDNIDVTHHYEDENGYTVSSDHPLAVQVSNMEYEEAINESKRTIKILDRAVIETVVREFTRMMTQ